jgi:hypothetical protein
MSSHIPIKVIIFDLGDILFQGSRNTRTTGLPSLVGNTVSSPPWYLHECGHLSQPEYCEQVVQQISLDASEVAEVFVQIHVSLQPDAALCDSLGIDCCMDRQALLHLYHRDSNWELGWMYRYGSTGLQIGNQGVTVAMFLKALLSQRSLPAIISEAP